MKQRNTIPYSVIAHIRATPNTYGSVAKLSRQFGISPQHVALIRNGKRYPKVVVKEEDQPFHITKEDIDKNRFWGQVNIVGQNDCWEWQGPATKQGYGKFFWRGKTRRAHRIAWAFMGWELEQETVLMHKCDNTYCCNPHHLNPGTTLDNIHDCVSKRRHTFGERKNTAKLTETQVVEIRDRYVPNIITMKMLAEEYGVKTDAIYKIVSRKTWAHI